MNGNQFESDDMPPELEDFSEELNKIRMTRGVDSKESTEIKVDVKEAKSNENINKLNETVKDKSDDNFGSFMKKGFFKRSNNTTSKTTDLTHIKATNKNPEKKIIEEFKEELKNNASNISSKDKSKILSNIVEKKDEWLNQELLMKIAQKPNLMKAFMNPKFSEVIALLQKDPEKALSQYGHIQEFNEFIKEFSSIMAEHFGKLSKDKEVASLNNFDEETQIILNDPKIIPIIKKLQTEGKLDIEIINNDPYISSRVNKLIEKGVFKLQRESEFNSKI